MKHFFWFPVLGALPLLLILLTGSERPACIPMGPGGAVCGPEACQGEPVLPDCGPAANGVCECTMAGMEGAACEWSCFCEPVGGVFPPGYIGLCPAEPWTDPSACGPQPGLRNYLCPDGITWAGPTGRCLQIDTGALDMLACEWEIIECPSTGRECAPEECGPALLMPCRQNPDGSVCGCATECVYDSELGQCNWYIPPCEPACEVGARCERCATTDLACEGECRLDENCDCVFECTTPPATCDQSACEGLPIPRVACLDIVGAHVVCDCVGLTSVESAFAERAPSCAWANCHCGYDPPCNVGALCNDCLAEIACVGECRLNDRCECVFDCTVPEPRVCAPEQCGAAPDIACRENPDGTACGCPTECQYNADIGQCMWYWPPCDPPPQQCEPYTPCRDCGTHIMCEGACLWNEACTGCTWVCGAGA